MSWEFRGITGSGNPPSALGSRKGAAIVIGGARCVWDDLKENPLKGAAKIVVNDIGCYIDWPIDHWVSMHQNYLQTWLMLRRRHTLAFNHDFLSHSHKSAEGISCAWFLDNPFGYSGMFAIQVALLLGYEKVLLCGVPQDGTGRFFDPPWVNPNHADCNRSFAQNAGLNPELMRCTRSMSGWTKNFFGGPETWTS